MPGYEPLTPPASPRPESQQVKKQVLHRPHIALQIPELVSSIAKCISSSQDLLHLSLVCKEFAPIVMAELWRAPLFRFQDNPLLWKLMLASSIASLADAKPSDEQTPHSATSPAASNPAPSTTARQEGDEVSATSNSSSTSSSSSSSTPPVSGGMEFAPLYFPYFDFVKELDLRRLSRPPVDATDPSRMAGRWPRLKTLRIGIVTPFMWGVRSILGGVDGPNTHAIGQALGGVHAGTESFGFAKLLQQSPRLEVLGIEPLPGDDGTTWLLEVLSLHAPPSLKRIELGRGRYLMSTQFSARRVWRAFFEFIIRSQIQHAIIVDHFYSIRTTSAGLWILTENYLNSVATNVGTAGGQNSTVIMIPSAQQLEIMAHQQQVTQATPFLSGVAGSELQGRFGSVVVFGLRGLNTIRRLAIELGHEVARSLFFHNS
ncbi:hypothetical protein HDU97_010145 [Phlyctochytrium planicorne]|nr:hypothetical protein HDU97_010145 [Phlyctochytrium planicorne]